MYLTTSLYKQKKESADLEDKMTEVTKSEGKKKKKKMKVKHLVNCWEGHHQTDQHNYYGHYRRKERK